MRPLLDCARPPLTTHQNGVKVWQESSAESLPLRELKAAWVCVKVAPSAQLRAVVVLHIVRSRRVNEPFDAICADETPYAIIEQESPLRSCISVQLYVQERDVQRSDS